MRVAGVPLALLATAVFTGCSERVRAGDFDYACTKGGGMFDGWNCRAEIYDHFLPGGDEGDQWLRK